MKKITLMLVAMLGMATTASAQYAGHKFTDNWSIGLEGGTCTNLCDWDTPAGGIVGINFTKGVTPILSLEFQVQAGINDGANWNWTMPAKTFSRIGIMGNTKVNLMNLFGGYKGAPRLFEIQARGGLGYSRFFFSGIPNPGVVNFTGRANDGNGLNRMLYTFGLDFDFNLGKAKAWTISLRPSILLKGTRDNDPIGYEFRSAQDYPYRRTSCDNEIANGKPNLSYLHNGVFQITAGVTYHFKTSNGKHHFTSVQPTEVTKTVEKIVEKPVEVVREKIVEKAAAAARTIDGTITVEFAQNKAVLTNTAKAKLNTIERGTAVALDGYASPEGNKTYNQKLSQRRCEAVKAYLEERGVKVIDINAHGAASPESQRVVYVTVK